MSRVLFGLGRLESEIGQMLPGRRNVSVTNIVELQTNEGIRRVLALALQFGDCGISLPQMAFRGVNRGLLRQCKASRGIDIAPGGVS